MIQPLGRDIVLHPIEQPSMYGKKIHVTDAFIEPKTDISAGGLLHLPDAYKKRPVKGVVIAKGKNCIYDEISIGDVVIVSAYAGEKVTLADEGIFWLVQEDDIAAVITAEPKIRLVDTETMERIIKEALGQFVQHGNSTLTEYEKGLIEGATEFSDNLITRLADLTQNEGFEF